VASAVQRLVGGGLAQCWLSYGRLGRGTREIVLRHVVVALLPPDLDPESGGVGSDVSSACSAIGGCGVGGGIPGTSPRALWHVFHVQDMV
jgi:hypothetical protein